MTNTTNSAPATQGGLAVKDVGVWDLVLYFLRLGAFGFGGPIALAGYMQRDLVPRGWVTQEEYEQGLAFAQMMPGPLAAQLAMWLGYVRKGALGASLVGVVFVLPPYLLVLVIAYLYSAYNGLPVVQALFYGVGPAIIAIIGLSAVRLARSTVRDDRRLWLIFGVVALITFLARTEVALLFVIAGIIGVLLYSPLWRRGKLKGPGTTTNTTSTLLVLSPLSSSFPSLSLTSSVFPAITLPLLWTLGGFFLLAGAFTFGSGLAIVPFLHEGVVVQHHWLNEQQFRDAVAVGIITPGPVVITAAFVGYLVAGFWGSLVSALAVFLPVYLFVLFIGRFILKYRHHPVLRGFVKGATAAASGAIAGAAVILGQGSIVDVPTAIISLLTLGALWRFKLPEPLLIGMAALAGIVLHSG